MKKFLFGLVMSFLLIGTAVAQTEAKVDEVAHAIARTEGFYVRGTIPNRLHNPGDIRSNRRGVYPGQSGLYHGYVVFRDNASGWRALRAQLQRIVDGTSTKYTQDMTFIQIGRVYAEDPQWPKTLCKILKISPWLTFAEFMDLPPRVMYRVTYEDVLRLFDGRAYTMPTLSSVPPMQARIRFAFGWVVLPMSNFAVEESH